ncbi:MAG: efflux RND transporter periplasmic adaptor subunit [Syntrophomonadaceae bacterium]|nr:efflux RND transporter periplasmic adaptor subunit [Syntrophomonadaceae bacterium]
MNWLRQRPVQLGVAAVLMVYLVFHLTRSTEVAALRISEQSYRPLLQISGEVVPARESQISAAQGGLITNIPVAEGQKVKQGDLLVNLDDASARLDMEQAKSDLQNARLSLAKAQTLSYQDARRDLVEDQQDLAAAEEALKRITALHEAGAASRQELEDAERQAAKVREKVAASKLLLESYTSGGSNLALLENQLHAKELVCEQNRLKLENCSLRAPFAGTVLEIQAEVGERITLGQQLVRLGAEEKLEVIINPDQQYKELIISGMKAEIWLPQTPDITCSGQVSRVEPAADPAQGTIGARILINNGDAALKPGSLVTVQLTAVHPVAGVILEEKWVTAVDGKTGVWVIEDNQAHFRNLTLGTRSSRGALVKQGLNKGDVVLQPGELVEGQRVKPKYSAGGDKS